MKKISGFIHGYIKESILGPLFKLLEATLELIVPLVVAAIIDNGINQANTGYVLKACLVLVALGAVGLIFSVTAQYFAAKASCGFTGKVRNALFSHIQTLSYSDLDKLGESTLITRMTNDANQVQNGLNLALRLLLRSPFVVFGAMIMAFTIDVKSAVTFAVVIPLLCVVVFHENISFSAHGSENISRSISATRSTSSAIILLISILSLICEPHKSYEARPSFNHSATSG